MNDERRKFKKYSRERKKKGGARVEEKSFFIWW
jgi:hypothetical protein